MSAAALQGLVHVLSCRFQPETLRTDLAERALGTRFVFRMPTGNSVAGVDLSDAQFGLVCDCTQWAALRLHASRVHAEHCEDGTDV